MEREVHRMGNVKRCLCERFSIQAAAGVDLLYRNWSSWLLLCLTWQVDSLLPVYDEKERRGVQRPPPVAKTFKGKSIDRITGGGGGYQ